jgi:hypothetical protein
VKDALRDELKPLVVSGMVAHTSNLSTQEVEAEHYEIEASLGYQA